MFDARPGLGGYLGRDVILGIRPSDFEDASLADPGWARITVTADVIEKLGSEIHAIFALNAPPVRHASITDAATGDEPAEDAVTVLAGGRSVWTARVAARSGVRSGQPAELAVDTVNMQFFDPASGLAIGRPAASPALSATTAGDEQA